MHESKLRARVLCDWRDILVILFHCEGYINVFEYKRTWKRVKIRIWMIAWSFVSSSFFSSNCFVKYSEKFIKPRDYILHLDWIIQVIEFILTKHVTLQTYETRHVWLNNYARYLTYMLITVFRLHVNDVTRCHFRLLLPLRTHKKPKFRKVKTCWCSVVGLVGVISWDVYIWKPGTDSYCSMWLIHN